MRAAAPALSGRPRRSVPAQGGPQMLTGVSRSMLLRRWPVARMLCSCGKKERRTRAAGHPVPGDPSYGQPHNDRSSPSESSGRAGAWRRLQDPQALAATPQGANQHPPHLSLESDAAFRPHPGAATVRRVCCVAPGRAPSREGESAASAGSVRRASGAWAAHRRTVPSRDAVRMWRPWWLHRTDVM